MANTKFDNGAINLTNTPNPQPPTSSQDIKLFQENGVIKTVDWAGKVAPISSEVKVAQVAVNTNEDANEFTIRIPSPNAKLQALELALRRLVESTQANLQENIDTVQGVLKSYQDSQNLANGIVDSNLKEIENKISELNDLINSKVDAIEFNKQLSSLQVDLGQFVTNINASLASKATKKELESGLREVKALIPKLPEAITVVADSSNVTVEKRGSEYGIAVDIPKVAKEVSRVSGVSENKVRLMIDAAIADISGGGTVTTITSTDGSIGVTAIPGGYDLAIISGGSGGTGTVPTITSNDGSIIVTPIVDGYDLKVASSGTVLQGRFQLDDVNTTFTIPHATISSSIEFPVCSLNVATSASDLFIVGIHDRTNTSFKVTISGVADSSTYIIWHIITQSFSGGGGGGASNAIIDLGLRMNTDSIFDCGTRI
jgi:hypothetical protein